MKNYLLSTTFLLVLFLFFSTSGTAATEKPHQAMEIGYSITITNVSEESMQYAKSVGISSIEIGFGALVYKEERKFKVSDEALVNRITKAKKAADDAGIEVWSIHMPFGPHIDLSLSNENDRLEVVDFHTKLLTYLEILKPKVILFHPSYFLDLNERELRTQQFVKSATELNRSVKEMNAIMVIENMLGPKLTLPNGKRERPLLRIVEETVMIMNRLPEDIYSAVDMNHIKKPENLILAMGSRLKTVHVADGDALAERHYLPCSGQGENDWTAILAALDKVNYQGPFMFESAHKDVKELKDCYDQLHAEYTKANSQ